MKPTRLFDFLAIQLENPPTSVLTLNTMEVGNPLPPRILRQSTASFTKADANGRKTRG